MKRFTDSITLDRGVMQYAAVNSVDLRLFIMDLDFWSDKDQDFYSTQPLGELYSAIRDILPSPPRYHQTPGGVIAYYLYNTVFKLTFRHQLDTALYSAIAGHPYSKCPLPPRTPCFARPADTPPSQSTSQKRKV